MADFEQLRAEITNLADKIEERNNELNCHRQRCNAATQQLAHIREKKHLLVTVLKENSHKLEQVSHIRTQARYSLGDLKANMIKHRQRYRRLINSSGLLTRADLLNDYDASDRMIEMLESKNAEQKKMTI